MTDEFTAPSPGLAHAFNARVERGKPLNIGQIATGGKRVRWPVEGGALEGASLTGAFVGGGETWLERSDGVTEVEADYYIRFAGGATARCFGKGYMTVGEDFSGLRLSLLFEAAEDSAVAELATRAFLAEQPRGSRFMTISRIT